MIKTLSNMYEAQKQEFTGDMETIKAMSSNASRMFMNVLVDTNNQLDTYETSELLEDIIAPMLSKKQREIISLYLCNRFPYQTSISCLENGLIEEN